jgi:prolyl-tRNA editing enzyme YbaK/EbsC (Cys-tRNA(Pro) deacylase)
MMSDPGTAGRHCTHSRKPTHGPQPQRGRWARYVHGNKNMQDEASIKARVISALDSYGVPYDVTEIDPDFADTAAFCEKYECFPEQSANTIIVVIKKQPRQYTASIVRATARLDVNHYVKQLMGNARVSFAGSEETAELTGMMIVGVTVLTLPPELPIYVDPGLMESEFHHARRREQIEEDLGVIGRAEAHSGRQCYRWTDNLSTSVAKQFPEPDWSD